MASELKTLIQSQMIRVLDLVIVTKDDDGSIQAAELRDVDDSEVGELRYVQPQLRPKAPLARTRSGCIAR